MGKTFKDAPQARRERTQRQERRGERGGHKNLIRTAMEEYQEELDGPDTREN